MPRILMIKEAIYVDRGTQTNSLRLKSRKALSQNTHISIPHWQILSHVFVTRKFGALKN